MRDDQTFSHVTAAQLWGMPLPSWAALQTDLDVSTVGSDTRPRTPGVRGHRLNLPTRRVRLAGLKVTDAATTWMQLAGIVALDDLIAAADYLIRTPRRPAVDDPRPHLSATVLAQFAERHRGRGRRHALEAVRWMRDGSDSPRETLLRLELMRAGLPEPRLNVPIVDAFGRFIAFGDLVYPEEKVLVEYDGEQHRLDSVQFQHDIARHEALLEAGWIHIRETKKTPAAGSQSTVHRTRRALALPRRSTPASGQFRS